MPEIRDVDAQIQEGRHIYKIGGKLFVAPEPDIDTLKRVLTLDAQSIAGAMKARDELRGTLEDSGVGEGAVKDSLAKISAAAVAGIDALYPQLQELVFKCNEEGQYVDGQDKVVEEGKRVAAPEAHLKKYLPAKRAREILNEILGEDSGRGLI